MPRPSKACWSALARAVSPATGSSAPLTITGSAYTSRKAASASGQASTGRVHNGRRRSSNGVTASGLLRPRRPGQPGSAFAAGLGTRYQVSTIRPLPVNPSRPAVAARVAAMRSRVSAGSMTSSISKARATLNAPARSR